MDKDEKINEIIEEYPNKEPEKSHKKKSKKRYLAPAACFATGFMISVGLSALSDVPNISPYQSEGIRDFSDTGYPEHILANGTETCMDTMASGAVQPMSENIEDAVSNGFEKTKPNDVLVSDPANAGVNDTKHPMIHYDLSFSIQTINFEKTLQAIQDLVIASDGILTNSNKFDSGDTWYMGSHGQQGVQTASFEIRVPDMKLSQVQADIQTLPGKLVSSSVTSEDMTRQYNSNADRITALRAEQKQLLSLMETASDTESLLIMYEYLTNINTELASLENVNNDIMYGTEYSTVRISVKAVQQYEEEPDDARLPFSERVEKSFKNGWTRTVRVVTDGVLFVAGYWTVLVGGLIVGLVGLVISKHKKKKREPRKTASVNIPIEELEE